MADEREPPMAIAMAWVSRIFAVVLMMVLPGLGGQRLDARWGTKLLGPAGFVLGLVVGVTYLIVITRQAEVARRRDADKGAQETRGRGPGSPQK